LAPLELAIRSLIPYKSGRKPILTGSVKSSPTVSLIKNTFTKRYRKRLIRYGLILGNLAIVAGAIIMIARHSGGNSGNFSALSTANEVEVSSPLDTLSSTDVAANIAIMAALPETGLIITDANTVSAELTSAVSSGDTVLKPQILSSDIKTKADIQDYIVVSGDTLASLATKFGVTSDSIKWSNTLNTNTLNPGIKLVIPPINGIAYTVKSGDSPDSLGKKFNVPASQIIQFNDAELSGLVVGERIVIPGGTIKAISSSRTPYYASFAFGNTAIYGYNGYVPGYCTWYVANKRIEIGRPLPANLGNAYKWDDNARLAGFRVDNIPAPGAAVVTKTIYNPGHVAYVEEVYYNPDGSLNSVKLSDMNGRNIRYEIRSFVIDAATAVGYNYIH
jgi:surface antigen